MFGGVCALISATFLVNKVLIYILCKALIKV